MRLGLLAAAGFLAADANAGVAVAHPPAVYTLHRQLLTGYANATTLTGKVASYMLAKNSEASTTQPIWSLSVRPCSGLDADHDTMANHCPADHSTQVWCDGYTESTYPLGDGTGLPYFMYAQKNAHVAMTNCETGDILFGNAEYDGMSFHGASVFKAIVQDLVKQGLGGSGKPEMLVLHGISSGSLGLTHQIDRVSDYLGKSAANVHIVGVLDSGIPLQPCVGASDEAGCKAMLTEPSSKWTTAYETTMHTIYEKYGVSFYGDECKWKAPTPEYCMYGEYHLPHLRTPFLLMANVFDKGLSQEVFSDFSVKPTTCGTCSGSDCSSFIKLATAINETYHSLRIQRAGNGMYLAGCYAHGVSNVAEFVTMEVDGTVMQDAVDYYLFRGHGVDWSKGPANSSASVPFLKWEDKCSGFNCGKGCPCQPGPGQRSETRAAGRVESRGALIPSASPSS